ncbi:MAG: site-specific DNA-methyltransferase, partial [Pedobacter sp.]
PESLCLIPLLATCPEDGVAIDPFCGTGTTNIVANRLGRRSIGIDISQDYLDYARQRALTSV